MIKQENRTETGSPSLSVLICKINLGNWNTLILIGPKILDVVASLSSSFWRSHTSAIVFFKALPIFEVKILVKINN